VGAGFQCLGTSLLWRGNDSSINDMLYKGYRDGNDKKDIGEYPAGKSRGFLLRLIQIWSARVRVYELLILRISLQNLQSSCSQHNHKDCVHEVEN